MPARDVIIAARPSPGLTLSEKTEQLDTMREEPASLTAAAVRERSTPFAPLRRSLRRGAGKHRAALGALVICHLLLFFPTLFMGRILSPNDLLSDYQPWGSLRQLEAQNATLDGAATGMQPSLAMLQRDPYAFHWNRYIASGVPGFGADATMSPFFLFPGLLLPLSLIYAGIIIAKLEFSFLFAYLWLREERMGKNGAAVGAITFAAAGIYSVWWLLHPTNATVLYPAWLFVVSRIFHGKRVGVASTAALGVLALVAGFPAMVAYGAYVVVAYSLFLMLRGKTFPYRKILLAIAGLALGAAIASPLIVPFLRFVKETGYVQARSEFSSATTYPLSQFRSFIDPWRLGDPAAHLWVGDPALGYSNELVESTVYLGLLALPLGIVGLLRKRSRARWFWLALAAIVICAIFGVPWIVHPLSRFPGIKFSPLSRLRVLLPLSAAYLAASGVSLIDRLRRLTGGWPRRITAVAVGLVIIVVASDLALFAARFYPYLPERFARLPESETGRFLRSQPPPFRILPFFTYFYPNTAEMVGLEDIRSHFSSEADYRAMLLRVDPSVWDAPTVLIFNDLKTRISDPFLSMLNVRYFIEQPNIDILRWSIYSQTVPDAPDLGPLPLPAGGRLERTIRVDEEPFHSIEIPIRVHSSHGVNPRVVFTLIRPETSGVLYQRTIGPEELGRMSKAYLPLSPFAREGNEVILRIESFGIDAEVPKGRSEDGEDPIYFGRVKSPVMIDHELPDGRIFLNVTEVPRFHAVWDVVAGDREEILRRTDLDFGRTAVTPGPLPDAARDLANVPPLERRAMVRVDRYGSSRSSIITTSLVPMLLATSEKLTPELRVTVDGRKVEPLRINLLFAGVPLSAGRHKVVFSRNLGGGLWYLALAGLSLSAIAAWLQRKRV